MLFSTCRAGAVVAGAALGAGYSGQSAATKSSIHEQLADADLRLKRMERKVGNHHAVPYAVRLPGLAARPGEPLFCRDDVSKHDNSSPDAGIWVTYRDGVYDVTDFADIHPGGAAFLKQAAGGPVDQWWQYWAYHHLSKKVTPFLEQYRIGRLSDWEDEEEDTDFYESDPERPKEQHCFFKQPWCSETQNEALINSYLTPNSNFYVRSHAPVPDIDAKEHTISFGDSNGSEKNISLVNLCKKFPEHTVTAIMQCAGNRAAEDIIVNGPSGFSNSPFASIGHGMMGNAQWSGVYLRDVIRHLYPDAVRSKAAMAGVHVHFEGADGYGTSTPLERIMDPTADVLLATKMNGEPMPLDHGFPVRVLLPGVAGARNVKWLSKVTLSNEESTMPWQATSYKETLEGERVSIQGLPLQSVVLRPHDGDKAKVIGGKLTVEGISYSGYTGSKIVRMEVSTNGGADWEQATLQESDLIENSDDSKKHYGWIRWSCAANVGGVHEGEVKIMCRATSADGVTQPLIDRQHHTYLYNGCHTITVQLTE
jgi:sulfite oxidase